MARKRLSAKSGSGYAIRVICLALVIFLILLLVLIGITIYREMDFKSNLPDPQAATEMMIYRTPNNTVVFKNADISVVSLGKGAKSADYLSGASSCVDVLFLSDVNDTVLQDLLQVNNHGKIGTIYLPRKTDRAMIKRFKGAFPDSRVLKAKKGEKFVLGEFVVRIFSVTENGTAFSLTHGENNFLVAQDSSHKLSALKDIRLKAVFAPFEPAMALENVEYFISLDETSAGALDFLADMCLQYVSPGSRLIYGLHTGSEVMFDCYFTTTGKLD